MRKTKIKIPDNTNVWYGCSSSYIAGNNMTKYDNFNI